MSENRGKKPDVEIDDFTQALLNKKTEMKLYGEEEVDSQESAINILRYQRQAEKEQQQDVPVSISQDDVPPVPEKRRTQATRSQTVSAPSSQPARKTAGSSTEKPASRKPAGDPQKKPRKKKRKVRRGVWITLIVLVICLFLGLGFYVYKVAVWDPENTVSEEQQNSYNKLVDYADEYDMMSDSEKLEILDLEADYESLAEKQKVSINAYYKEQTGKNFPDLLQELKTISGNNTEDNEDYAALKNFFDQWADYSDEQKAQVVSLKSAYDSLNQTLRNQIDALILEKTGTNFSSLYTQYTTQKAEEPDETENGSDPENTDSPNTSDSTEESGAYSEEISYLQSQIDSIQAQISELQTYNATLQEDMAVLSSQGEDVSEYQSYIDENNASIASLQAQLDSLYQQMAQYQ